MSAKPFQPGPAREVIAPSHVSLRKEVGREAGPTPLEYGEVRLWLVAKGPQSLYSYWEFRPEEHPEAIGADGRARFFLRIMREGGGIEETIEIDPVVGNWTAAVKHIDAAYSAELGFYNAKGVWCFLARSGVARTVPTEVPSRLMPATPKRRRAPAVPSSVEWTNAQEKRLNRILADEIARHQEPKSQRPPRARAKSRRSKK